MSIARTAADTHLQYHFCIRTIVLFPLIKELSKKPEEIKDYIDEPVSNIKILYFLVGIDLVIDSVAEY